MRNILVLTRREIASYFVSPVAYVVIGLFLVLSGAFFALGDFYPGAPAQMRSIFDVMMVILIFILPLLTMRSLAEEFRSGTIETLMTAPVTDVEVVVGKFLGCWLVYLAMLAPTLVYVVLLAAFGQPDYGPIAAGYLGLALLGAFYIAVGIFASSMSQSQVLAAIVAVVTLALLGILAPWIAAAVPSFWRHILQQAAVRSHYTDFSQGVVDLVHVLYFVALTLYVLFLAVKIVESRRWR
jgi:ABC-2 type transport system permease protein